MKIRLFGCRKFRWLSNEQYDRKLSKREKAFLERHRAVCPECHREEFDGAIALNMLREAILEPASESPHFEERVLRKLRVQRVREGVTYWSPALIGATIAAVTVLAITQLITRSGELQHVKIPGAPEARRVIREDSTRLPNLVLSDTSNTSATQPNGS